MLSGPPEAAADEDFLYKLIKGACTGRIGYFMEFRMKSAIAIARLRNTVAFPQTLPRPGGYSRAFRPGNQLGSRAFVHHPRMPAARPDRAEPTMPAAPQPRLEVAGKLARLTRSRGAKRGANGIRSRATPSDNGSE